MESFVSIEWDKSPYQPKQTDDSLSLQKNFCSFLSIQTTFSFCFNLNHPIETPIIAGNKDKWCAFLRLWNGHTACSLVALTTHTPSPVVGYGSLHSSLYVKCIFQPPWLLTFDVKTWKTISPSTHLYLSQFCFWFHPPHHSLLCSLTFWEILSPSIAFFLFSFVRYSDT